MAAEWPTARDLMTPHPITIAHDAPLSSALGIMRTRHIHELPVLRRRGLIGMITLDAIARRTNLGIGTKVEHLMMLPPLITEGTPYPELAERLLATGLRAAPVVGRRNELVGVVSRTDLVRAMPSLTGLGSHRVEEIASPVGVVVGEKETVEKLMGHVRLLEEHPRPVVDRQGRLVGAVGLEDLSRVFWRPIGAGKRDAVRHAPRERRDFQIEVSTIMRSPPVTVPLGTSAAITARVVAREKVSSAFVVDGGRPVGVVSQGDLLGLAVGAGARPGTLRPSTSDVYVQIHGLRGGADPETLAEIDRVVAQGLRRVSRHVRPLLLSLHIRPHATHRSGDATVEARLHTSRGIYYASDTEWNYFAGIATLMDELAEQVRRAKEEARPRGGAAARAGRLGVDETVGAPELEAQLRAIAPARRRRR
jgi:CBS domain-containing protein/ribosome-associated translation inhibitor RaiA